MFNIGSVKFDSENEMVLPSLLAIKKVSLLTFSIITNALYKELYIYFCLQFCNLLTNSIITELYQNFHFYFSSFKFVYILRAEFNHY